MTRRRARLSRHVWAVPAAVVALAAHVARFGYAYGEGDQDELIPSAMALLDPALFQRDWLVQYVVDGVNVRTAFVWLVATAGALVPLPAVVAALHGLAILAAALGLYGLGWVLTRSRAAALLGSVGAVAVTPAFTIGANAVVAPLLTPEGLAWTLVLPAVALFLRGHRRSAGALLGVAAWMHLLTGLLPALALGLVALWRAAERAPGATLRGAVVFGVVFAVAALPIVLPVGLGQLAGDAGGTPSPFYIHAVFRNPFHHLWSAIPLGQHVRFWGLLALGAAGLAAMHRWGAAPYAPEVARLWIVTGLLCGVAAVFVDVVPVEAVAKLQFLKLSVLASLLATLTAAGGAVALLGRWRAVPAVALLRRAAPLGLAAAGIVSAGLLAGAVAGAGPLATRVSSRAHAATPLAGVERWARDETPVSALFAVPPSVGTFRSGARRAVVANWHAFVFGDVAMGVWYGRLRAVAPIAPPPPRADRKPLLDAAYAARTPADWRRLTTRFGLDYLLLPASAGPLPLPVAHRTEGWTVYVAGPSAGETP